MRAVKNRLARVVGQSGRSPAPAHLAVGVAALLSLVGCSEVLDIPDDPKLSRRGPWWCLDNPPQAAAPRGDSAIVRIQACNFVSTNCSEPITGITAKLCDKKDVSCTNPIQPQVIDNEGALLFDVPTGGALGVGFDGYLKITPPAAMCNDQGVFGPAAGLLCAFAAGCDQTIPNDERCLFPLFAPSSLYFNPPVKNDIDEAMPLPLIPTKDVVALIQVTGAAFDPTAGMVFVTALDCNGDPAAGVTFAVAKDQDRVTALYEENGLITSTGTQTDVTGLGGFINVPPGFVSVEGYIGSDENRRLIAAFGVQVTTFNISYSTLVPLP